MKRSTAPASPNTARPSPSQTSSISSLIGFSIPSTVPDVNIATHKKAPLCWRLLGEGGVAHAGFGAAFGEGDTASYADAAAAE